MIVGLDVGGTNIDAVIINNHNVVRSIKVPMESNNVSDSIIFALDSLLSSVDALNIDKIHLSTTVSTNAIVTNTLSKVGLIIQTGPGMNLEEKLRNLDCFFIGGYVNHQGVIIQNIKEDEIDEAIASFKSRNINYGAIITKFSSRNPQIEETIHRLMKDDFEFVSCGHNLSDNLNFPRRIFTAYLNAAVYLSFKQFKDSLDTSLEKYDLKALFNILKADGGTMSLKEALNKPVETILSGPAASLMGMMALMSTKEDAVCLDVGGTTTDIFFLADGVPLFEPQGATIDSYQTLVRSIACTSIGLGGDSRVKIHQGKLTIGPQKDGASYAYGGPSPTPTDAMIVLGLIDINDVSITNRAQQAMEILRTNDEETTTQIATLVLETMAFRVKETIEQLLEGINSKPVYTIKELLTNKTIQPQSIHIIGAPARSLSPFIEKVTGLPVIVPEHYDVANAIGAALATTTMHLTLVADTYQGKLTIAQLNQQRNISRNYNIENAKDDIVQALMEATSLEHDAIEITEANSFLMVKNGYRVGNNIRVIAQVKPGYLNFLRGDDHES